MTKVARALCAAVLTVVMVSCSNGAAKVAQIAPTPIATADYSGTGPGSLIEAMSMPNIDRKIRALGAKAVRVVYRSTSGIDDTPTEVSAAVFIPTGTAPPGGWPVIAYAHGTSGI
ncbi:MAG: alpha/beta hydrolase, partial [Mycobacterium sp.]